VSALFLFSLGTVTLVSTGRERVWYIFAAFCFMVGISSTFGFLTEVSGSSSRLFTFVKLELFFALISLSFANFYGMELTGFRFGVTAKHNSIKNFIVLFFIVVWTSTLLMLFLTDWVIKSATPLSSHGIKLYYGPAMWGLLGMFFIGTVRNFVFLLDAYRKTNNPAFREFLMLNVLAFHTIFAPAIWLLFVLPVFGLPTQLLAFLAFPVSVTIFYVAIVRFQVARVRELNVTLEQKVLDRTEELRKTQTRLAQSERMASLGQLVAGVAHELNNPVGAVQSMAESVATAVDRLENRVQKNEAGEEDWARFFGFAKDAGRVISEGTRKITRVVNDLRNFARLDESVLQMVNINTELEETIKIMKGVLEPSVTITREYGNVPDIMCNPAQLNQVFLNLLINAREAIRGDGTITLGTGLENGRLRISIRDDGEGIDSEYIDKVFEPGFTTKGVGVGTGLGLAICYRIIQDHGGQISVSSRPSVGTTFMIFLPTKSPGL